MPNVHVVAHPLVQHKLTLMRDKTVSTKGFRQLMNEIGSWMTGVNRNLAGKQKPRIMRYSGGHPAYREHCDAVAASGYRSVALA